MLDKNICYNTYLQHPGASLGEIARILFDNGIFNPSTGKPYSKQAISTTLRSTPEGVALLENRKKNRHADRFAVARRVKEKLGGE